VRKRSEPSRLRTLWTVLVGGFLPVRKAGQIAVLALSVGGVGAIAFLVYVHSRGWFPWTIVGATGVWLIGQIAFGCRVQWALNVSTLVDFDFEAATPEFTDDTDEHPEGEFKGRSIIWVVVTNSGPPAEFSAEFNHVQGGEFFNASGTDISTYSHSIAWEYTIDVAQHLVRYEDGRLCVAFCHQEPKSFWFMTPHTPLWRINPNFPRQIKGRSIVPRSNAVTFDLTVHNRTADKRHTKHATIEFLESGHVSFQLSQSDDS